MVPKWTQAVKEKYGDGKTKFGCTGYCFGAPFVMNLLASEAVAAGAFAHPSMLKEEHFAAIKSKKDVGVQN
jgi:dienelactone hydrolase